MKGTNEEVSWHICCLIGLEVDEVGEEHGWVIRSRSNCEVTVFLKGSKPAPPTPQRGEPQERVPPFGGLGGLFGRQTGTGSD